MQNKYNCLLLVQKIECNSKNLRKKTFKNGKKNGRADCFMKFMH